MRQCFCFFVLQAGSGAKIATTRQLADDVKKEIVRLRIIARNKAITARLRLKHGTWRFSLVTPHPLAGIDRRKNRSYRGRRPCEGMESFYTTSRITGRLFDYLKFFLCWYNDTGIFKKEKSQPEPAKGEVR